MAQITSEGNKVIIRFAGQLNFATCEPLEGEIAGVLAKNPDSVVFDLADVTFIASVFLRLCLKTFKELGRERFGIVNVSPAMKKIFTIAGLDEMVRIG